MAGWGVFGGATLLRVSLESRGKKQGGPRKKMRGALFDSGSLFAGAP